MIDQIKMTKGRPIPKFGETISIPVNGGVIPYQLNDAELEFARTGRLDLIPTAVQRGLVAPPPIPRKVKEVVSEQREQRKAFTKAPPELNAERLRQHIDEGLTNREIGAKYNISESAVTRQLQKFDMGGKRGHSRIKRKSQKGIAFGEGLKGTRQ